MKGSAKCSNCGHLGWLGVTQGHRQCRHSIERLRLGNRNYASTINRNYASIFYHFRVIVSYLSKVVNFWTTICKNGSPNAIEPLSCPSVYLSVTLMYCGQTVGWIKMKLGMEVGLGPGHIVLNGDPAPLPKRAQPPILAHVYCGQTAECIKMPLGTEIGLGHGNIVLDGDPAPAKRGHSTPTFRPCLLRPNGWMDQDETWHGCRPRPRPHCFRWGSISP